MKALALALLTALSILGTADMARAQYYYPVPGPGYYDDDAPPPYYRRRYQEVPPPYYGRRYYGEPGIQAQDNFGNPEAWFRPYVDRYGRPFCRQPGYTVQDGFCKRYRGY